MAVAGSALPGGNIAASSRSRSKRVPGECTGAPYSRALRCRGGALPIGGFGPTQETHPAPAGRYQPGLRGADGRRRLLLGLVAALPPQPAVADRGVGGVAAPRPLDEA